MIKKCSVEGCDRQARAKGMCRKHYMSFYRTGDPISKKPKYSDEDICSVNGCNKKTVVKGMCRSHYNSRSEAGKKANERLKVKGIFVEAAKKYRESQKGKENIAKYNKSKEGRDNNVKSQQKRRARKRGVEVESVAPKDIYERDNWTCYLCGKEINKTSKAPHPKSPSLDHVVPICKGGSHTYDNLKAAHLYCNQSKGGKTLEEYREYCEQRQGS